MSDDKPVLGKFYDPLHPLRIFECPICRYVGLYDEGWQGGIHSEDCIGFTIFTGWLTKTKPIVNEEKLNDC